MLYFLMTLVTLTKGDYVGQVLEIQKENLLEITDFQSGFGDWTQTHMKLEDTGLNNMAAVPQPTMSGDQWGHLVRELTLAPWTQLDLTISIKVSGYSGQVEQDPFIPSQPDMKVTLKRSNEWGNLSSQLVADMKRIKPVNDEWNSFKMETSTGDTEHPIPYLLTISAMGGSNGYIALDNISVEAIPLVGENIHRVVDNTDVVTNLPVNTSAVIANNNTINSTGIVSSSANVTENTTMENNNTVIANNSDDTKNVTQNAVNNATVEAHKHELVNETIVSHNVENGKNDPNKITTLPSNITASNYSFLDTNSVISPSFSYYPVYGYAGQVVLICLTIMFAVLSAVVAFKYHRLRSHAGDYRVSATTQPNRNYS